MTKLEIIKSVAKQTGVDKETVSRVIDMYVETVKDSLIRGENVNFRNFGTFYLKHRAAKTARNIAKNTTMIIPEHNIAAFKPARELA
ncbi:Histone-like bacterial DNA-binding protein, partial [gut metagenome]